MVARSASFPGEAAPGALGGPSCLFRLLSALYLLASPDTCVIPLPWGRRSVRELQLDLGIPALLGTLCVGARSLRRTVWLRQFLTGSVGFREPH